ncbi:hypothetical protein [Cohnella cellulosilytica]|uniref:hypothetical protein n=1 Tax=Cohnella cellulosilytica TaxID=986710 RepID=UPI003606E25B
MELVGLWGNKPTLASLPHLYNDFNGAMRAETLAGARGLRLKQAAPPIRPSL